MSLDAWHFSNSKAVSCPPISVLDRQTEMMLFCQTVERFEPSLGETAQDFFHAASTSFHSFDSELILSHLEQHLFLLAS